MSVSLPFKDPEEVRRYGYNATPRGVSELDPIVSARGDTILGDVVTENVTPMPDGLGVRILLSGGTVSDDANEIKIYYDLASGQVLDDTLKIKIKLR